MSLATPRGFFCLVLMIPSNKQEKTIVFIDGNNWYHAVKAIGVSSSKINYQALARKLSLSSRKVVEIRYYVGKVSGLGRSRDQEKFLSIIKAQGVKVILGRVEKKWTLPENNPIQKKLQDFLSSSSHCITDSNALDTLRSIASQTTASYTEKRVDVNIAVDMVAKAMKNEFDVAYLLSADGDFVPAVEAVREMGKKVFAASPGRGHELNKAVNSFIPLPSEWFSEDVFLDSST